MSYSARYNFGSECTPYKDTGPICRFGIYLFGTLHWNTQLPILMAWVNPYQEFLPRPSTSASKAELFDAVKVSVSQKVSRKRTAPSVSWPRDL